MSERSKKPVIIVWGRPDTGKTTSIKLSIAKMIEGGGYVKWLENEANAFKQAFDICGVIRYQGKNIGIYTPGDPDGSAIGRERHLNRIDSLLESALKCDIAVVGCRTSRGFQLKKELGQAFKNKHPIKTSYLRGSKNPTEEEQKANKAKQVADNERMANKIIYYIGEFIKGTL